MTKRNAPRKRAVIPAGCASMDAVYDILSLSLGLPAHFGRNLDALYDALTGDVEGPFEIVIEDAKALERKLGAKGEALFEAIEAAVAARKDARFVKIFQ